ncbi:MAG: cyclic nucleotide-binding protein, partial [Microthrixaceae bacterium]|nr:cyclic nucleotide-binding protein [Microthrixaceae bacterium]
MSQLTEHLARIPLLAGCSSRDLELLGRAADQITLRGGSTLTRQGDIGREAFVLLDG